MDGLRNSCLLLEGLQHLTSSPAPCYVPEGRQSAPRYLTAHTTDPTTVARPDQQAPQVIKEALPVLQKLKKDGLIRHIGFSCYPLACFHKMLDRQAGLPSLGSVSFNHGPCFVLGACKSSSAVRPVYHWHTNNTGMLAQLSDWPVLFTAGLYIVLSAATVSPCPVY